MRSLLVLSAIATVGAAHASFELVMVADRGSKSVHRYDGSTGVYLGQFGNGYLQNPMSMALDQVNNRVFVADQVGTGDGSGSNQVRIWSFNYNTGEYLSSFRTSYNYLQPQIAYDGVNLLVGHDGSIYDVYSTSGSNVLTWAWSGATNPKGLATSTGGMHYAVEGNKLYSRNSVGVQSTFTMTSSISASSTPGQRQLAISGNRALAVGAISFSAINLASLSTSNTANSLTTTTLANYNQINGAGFGHGDVAYIAGTNGTIGQMSRVLYSEGIQLQVFGSGQLIEPRSIAVVNAPEPATFGALGAGLLVLTRRRRK